ncbi:MAG TPA: hypothetical protein VL137_09205 [Polyangiaceae bacterium]|nr:hypothetical protein [Polyangiaceae bacterium]
MRFPQTLSSEFPNDNPKLHQGASWLCLDPLSAPRPVARPDVVSKAALKAALPAMPVPATPLPANALKSEPISLDSTLLPPASAETDQFVSRFITRLLDPKRTGPRPNSDGAPRMASIAQFMLDELPSYKLRRSPSQIPPPPQHVFLNSTPPQALAEDFSELCESEMPSEAPRGQALHSEIRAIKPAQPVLLDSALPSADSALDVVEAKFVAMDEQWVPVVLQAQDVDMAELCLPVVLRSEHVELAMVSQSVAAPLEQVVAALAVEVAVVESSAPARLESAELGAYESFVAALSDVLLQQGATRGAALVRALIEQSRLELNVVGETLVQQLSAAGIGSERGEQFVVSAAFAEAACAWRAVLRGDCSEFAGADTLDQWATALLVALLPCELTSKEIRKQLRRRGVAAFGMLAAA